MASRALENAALCEERSRPGAWARLEFEDRPVRLLVAWNRLRVKNHRLQECARRCFRRARQMRVARQSLLPTTQLRRALPVASRCLFRWHSLRVVPGTTRAP